MKCRRNVFAWIFFKVRGIYSHRLNVYCFKHFTGLPLPQLEGPPAGVCPLPAATPPAFSPLAACDTARCRVRTSPSRNRRHPPRIGLPVEPRFLGTFLGEVAGFFLKPAVGIPPCPLKNSSKRKDVCPFPE